MSNELNNYPTNTLSERFKINSALAMKFEVDKDYNKAVNYYTEMLKEYNLMYQMDSGIPEAFPDFVKVIAGLQMKIFQCYFQLGETYSNNKEFENAINSYKSALTYNQGDYFIYYKLGLCFKNFKMNDTAIYFLKITTKLNPSYEDAYRILGDIFAFDNKEEMFKAYKYYCKYISLNKSNGYIYNMLGHLLSNNFNIKDKSINKQIQYFSKAVDLLPDVDVPLHNLAMVCTSVGLYDKALECHEKLQRKRPDGNYFFNIDRNYFFNLGRFQMKIGKFAEGLKNFEYRSLSEFNHGFRPDKPVMEKGTSLANKRILVRWEFGFGDTIQFVRYLPYLEKIAKKVLFSPQKELYSLIKKNYPSIEVIPPDTDLSKVEFDLQMPLMSLPYYLSMYFDNIPYKDGYIKADPVKVSDYKKEFFENSDLKIGIHWRGKYTSDIRDVNLELFFPIIKLKNVKVYSLQTKDEAAASELNNLPEDIKITSIFEKMQNFDDSTAMIENMDLIITSDSSTVHLAGGMGKKTFLLLPNNTNWRWFAEEETSSFYSSVKIFKQKNEYDNWDEAMNRVLAQVKQDYNL